MQQKEYLCKIDSAIDEYKRMMSSLLNLSEVKKEEVYLAEERNRKHESVSDTVDRYLKTLKRTKLFANHHAPREDKADSYRDIGFFWPMKEDLQNLMVDYNVEIKDLILEKIQWKGGSCGFSMIQLVFKNGITSPAFKVADSNEEDYTTSTIKQGEKINFVKVNVADNKFIENFSFHTIKEEDPQPENILGNFEPCRCGQDDWEEIEANQHIVGLFGITSNATNKSGFDFIRGLGFITMNINV